MGRRDPLKVHRREVTVFFVDLSWFLLRLLIPSDPEEVMVVLREYPCGDGKDHCPPMKYCWSIRWDGL